VKSRVLTAIGLIPFVLGTLLFVNPWPLVLLSLTAIALSTFELDRLFNFPSRYTALAYTLAAGAFSVWGVNHVSIGTVAAVGFSCFAFGVTGGYVRARDPESLVGALVAPLWVVAPIMSLFVLHAQTHTTSAIFSVNPILMAIVPLWGGDSAAYFVGKQFGKRLLAPKISPKKTVEGGVANVFACLAIAIPLGGSLGYTLGNSILCGLSAGIFGQIGDLFESYLKRQANLKDSGSLLPGHGGILDRIDSILFTAPIVFLVLANSH